MNSLSTIMVFLFRMYLPSTKIVRKWRHTNKTLTRGLLITCARITNKHTINVNIWDYKTHERDNISKFGGSQEIKCFKGLILMRRSLLCLSLSVGYRMFHITSCRKAVIQHLHGINANFYGRNYIISKCIWNLKRKHVHSVQTLKMKCQ